MARYPQLRSFRHLATVLLAGGIGVAGIPLLVSSTSSATSTTITGLRAQAAEIADQVATINTKIEILSEEYDEAASRASSLAAEEKSDASSFAAAQSQVSKDTASLHTQAVDAYVNADASSGLTTAFSSKASTLPQQQTYMAAAAGNLDTAIAALHNSEITLSARRASLAQAESDAQSNAQTLANSRSSAMGLESKMAGTLANVKGNLAAAVQQAQAEAQAQAQAAAATEAQQAEQAAASAGGPVGGTVTSIGGDDTSSSPTSGSGSAAVAAAETQQGVPYVWAGDTPGEGFDCSGLVMWAWGKAGVSLPHSAEGQYESIEHVSASDLEPGDLIFYASGGYVYHVVMYVGGGQTIQAEDTGTRIFIGPIPPGAYAYGRP